MAGLTALDELIKGMEPVLRQGDFVYTFVGRANVATLPPHEALVREPEGITLVMRREDADAADLRYDFVAGWITLTVHSALDAVGLTSAIATALTEAGVSCNVLAGYHHDHILVPRAQVGTAMDALQELAGTDRC
ncbi:MAG: ACT domain-containing protein [Ornithinimicrobium sp.]